ERYPLHGDGGSLRTAPGEPLTIHEPRQGRLVPLGTTHRRGIVPPRPRWAHGEGTEARPGLCHPLGGSIAAPRTAAAPWGPALVSVVSGARAGRVRSCYLARSSHTKEVRMPRNTWCALCVLLAAATGAVAQAPSCQVGTIQVYIDQPAEGTCTI